MGERIGAYKEFMGKPEGRSPFITSRSTWEYTIKMDL
jgi:hypothetical protein